MHIKVKKTINISITMVFGIVTAASFTLMNLIVFWVLKHAYPSILNIRSDFPDFSVYLLTLITIFAIVYTSLALLLYAFTFTVIARCGFKTKWRFELFKES